MTNETCLVDINPDAMNFGELCDVTMDLRYLINYLETKKQAMACRIRGQMNEAMTFEVECDRIYVGLPKSVKSW